MCGSGVGTFLFAPIANYLLTVADWQTSNRIFGGVCLLCLLCGAAMRPLKVEVEPLVPVEEEQTDLVITLPDGTKVPASNTKGASYKGVPPIRLEASINLVRHQLLHKKEAIYVTQLPTLI